MTETSDCSCGVVVPLVTPVDEDERVDEGALRGVIRRCLSFGAKGLFAGGSAGMGPLLTERQWVRAMEIAYDEAGGACVLMGGVITSSTAIALERIKVLDAIGYRTMVVTPTFYIKLERDAELLCHFGACRQATEMEMVIYNIPACTGSSISLTVVEEVGRRGWSSCVKESSGNREYVDALLKVCARTGMAVLQGHEPDIAWALQHGAAGIVPVCANYEPSTFVAACEAAVQNDAQRLAALQERIGLLGNVLLKGQKNWISGIMYGMHTLGIGTGRPLRPLQALSPDARRMIDDFKSRDSAADTAG